MEKEPMKFEARPDDVGGGGSESQEQIPKLGFHPYNVESKKVLIPDLVEKFMKGDFSDSLDDYSVVINTDREDTGQGVSYKNQLIVKKGDEIIYDTGMITYRGGRAGESTNHDFSFRKAGLLIEDNKILLGIETGSNKILVEEVADGRANQIDEFDVTKYKLDKLNNEIDPKNLEHLRRHFINRYNRGEQYPWKVGTNDRDLGVGTGFFAYHNGRSGRGGTIWDKGVVVFVNENGTFITDEFAIPLDSGSEPQWQDSGVRKWEIVDGVVTMYAVTARYNSFERDAYLSFPLSRCTKVQFKIEN